ncbi:Calcium-binding mitochondrial carrier protein Aralar1 [Intoshia linei]|uniref:Calcium-binding mitochondrial carrier protein Aralar1 n=1 Tax=Intoshia linei TaxID=1819745 RepID=A0A177B6V7_9BILA|nr:Calcium-binding mitochondrial carrier protein Aralar1 [Intoshia linei]
MNIFKTKLIQNNANVLFGYLTNLNVLNFANRSINQLVLKSRQMKRHRQKRRERRDRLLNMKLTQRKEARMQQDFENFKQSELLRIQQYNPEAEVDKHIKLANIAGWSIDPFKTLPSSLLEKGTLYVNIEEFLNSIYKNHLNQYDYQQLHKILTYSTAKGIAEFEHIQNLQHLLSLPDSNYQIAYELCQKNGCINFDNFKKCIANIDKLDYLNFNFNFFQLYFGKTYNVSIHYPDFVHFLNEFTRECDAQFFFKLSNDGCTISNDHFIQFAKKRFKDTILFSFFNQNNLKNIDRENWSFAETCSIINVARKISTLTSNGTFNCTNNDKLIETYLKTFNTTVLDKKFLNFFKDSTILSDLKQASKVEQVEKSKDGAIIQAKKGIFNFVLGGIAGGIGAMAVYPIDLVKTRMQNQRKHINIKIDEILYKSSVDCAKKVLRHEGLRGLYRGLLPQLVGVAPEKAIKLTVNDFMRSKLRRGDEVLPFWKGMIAGGSAGFCQVLFTNPLEIVKIQLQIAAEGKKKSAVTAGQVVRQLGIRGLYRYSSACMLRDAPFSAIFFPVYHTLKNKFQSADGHISMHASFATALLSGIPAAYLVTPADVIKTRLQAFTKANQVGYKNIIDCVQKIYSQEGLGAFMKGSIPRVIRSAPQFGVTLCCYELLKMVFKLQSDEKLDASTIGSFNNPTWKLSSFNKMHTSLKTAKSDEKPGIEAVNKFKSNAVNLVLGGIAGDVGASFVYPIDFVKTRMQNQQKTKSKVLYNNSLDCARKIIKFEGFRGIYRGLLPQLVGVTPEKAVELAVNDLMRKKLRKGNEVLPFYKGIIAGATAGVGQVIFTNPLEMVKIQLQISAEGKKTTNATATQIIRQLGIPGLYKHVTACMMRDGPFSGIFFPVYHHLKHKYKNDDETLSISTSFFIALISGVPAAYLVTPADVIKTRLQSLKKQNHNYTGIIDCAQKIYKHEGPGAFFKGSIRNFFYDNYSCDVDE